MQCGHGVEGVGSEGCRGGHGVQGVGSDDMWMDKGMEGVGSEGYRGGHGVEDVGSQGCQGWAWGFRVWAVRGLEEDMGWRVWAVRGVGVGMVMEGGGGCVWVGMEWRV